MSNPYYVICGLCKAPLTKTIEGYYVGCEHCPPMPHRLTGKTSDFESDEGRSIRPGAAYTISAEKIPGNSLLN